MCSTFKLLAVAAMLHRVDGGKESLDRHISYDKADSLDYAPLTREQVGEGFMTVGALGEAAIELSDNTAANLLLGTMGGPPAVTQYARSIGDAVTRLDHRSPHSTPTRLAIRATRRRRWRLLRAGIPATWRAGDKSGMGGANNPAGDSDTRNDVAILWPPHRAPLIVAAYLTGSQLPAKQRDATLAGVATEVTQTVK